MLDKFTFGRTPGAIYLTERLNQLGDPKLTRKVSSYLDQESKILNEIVQANAIGVLSTHTLGAFVTFMRHRIGTSTLEINDKLTADLMHNVVSGRVKSILRRTVEATKQSRSYHCARVLKLSILNIIDPKTPDVLIERSRQKLDRKHKPRTYY